MVKRKICFASLCDAQGSRCQTCQGQSVTRMIEIWAKKAVQVWSIFAITESTVDLTTKYTLDHAEFASADSTTTFEMRIWLMCSWVFKVEYVKQCFHSPMLPHEQWPKTGANLSELRATIGIASCLDFISPHCPNMSGYGSFRILNNQFWAIPAIYTHHYPSFIPIPLYP